MTPAAVSLPRLAMWTQCRKRCPPLGRELTILLAVAVANLPWYMALAKPSTASTASAKVKSPKSSGPNLLKGQVTQSEIIDDLERVGIKCGVVEGSRPSLVVVDVHRGTSAFNNGVESGDKIAEMRTGNGGFNLTFQRGTEVFQVFLRSSAIPFSDRVNHSQIEAEISEAAKRRLKKLALLDVHTGNLSRMTVLDAIDGVHMGALRRTKDTAIVENQTLEGLRWVPQPARTVVWNAGVRVLLTPSIIDLDESFKSGSPRGVHGGYTALAGLYLGGSKIMAIAERVQYRNNLPELADSRKIICHEFGHAFDECLARKFGTFALFTRTTMFKEIYHDEATRLTNEQRRHLEYFTQPDGAGESECFAQLFSALCAPASNNDALTTELEEAFPRTKALIKSVMLDPSICQGLTED